mmetsp:Transcript_20469/g.62422  ORF Transcript_20469/g.62422 Transcript_20469/m.62422 type:complete len:403 (-) Transcript_20469:1076-2284(-)
MALVGDDAAPQKQLIHASRPSLEKTPKSDVKPDQETKQPTASCTKHAPQPPVSPSPSLNPPCTTDAGAPKTPAPPEKQPPSPLPADDDTDDADLTALWDMSRPKDEVGLSEANQRRSSSPMDPLPLSSAVLESVALGAWLDHLGNVVDGTTTNDYISAMIQSPRRRAASSSVPSRAAPAGLAEASAATAAAAAVIADAVTKATPPLKVEPILVRLPAPSAPHQTPRSAGVSAAAAHVSPDKQRAVRPLLPPARIDAASAALSATLAAVAAAVAPGCNAPPPPSAKAAKVAAGRHQAARMVKTVLTSVPSSDSVAPPASEVPTVNSTTAPATATAFPAKPASSKASGKPAALKSAKSAPVRQSGAKRGTADVNATEPASSAAPLTKVSRSGRQVRPKSIFAGA